MLLPVSPYYQFLSQNRRAPLTICLQLSPCLGVIVLRDLNFVSKVEALGAATLNNVAYSALS
jgi:hypothetical protein